MHEVLEVVGMVTAVDPLRILPELSVSDQLVEHSLHTCAEDDRTLAEALAHQIEYAGVLAVASSQRARGSAETDLELAAGESGWKALPDAFEELLDPVA